ncbi:MAG: hypothetical protein WAQ27_01660 [Candidatus Microsaccharimonas sp.]
MDFEFDGPLYKPFSDGTATFIWVIAFALAVTLVIVAAVSIPVLAESFNQLIGSTSFAVEAGS